MTAVTSVHGTIVAAVSTPVDDESRSAILEAAKRLLAEEGAAALTVRRIAAEAGGSTMNVYSRFGGKDGVVEALFIEGFARLSEAVAHVRKTGDPLADLRACARAYRQFALANRTYYAIMFEGIVTDFVAGPEGKSAASATLGMLAGSAQRAIDAGQLVHPNANALAADLWATNHGLVSLELRPMGPPDVNWPKRHAETIAAVLRGFTPAALAKPALDE